MMALMTGSSSWRVLEKRRKLLVVENNKLRRNLTVATVHYFKKSTSGKTTKGLGLSGQGERPKIAKKEEGRKDQISKHCTKTRGRKNNCLGIKEGVFCVGKCCRKEGKGIKG